MSRPVTVLSMDTQGFGASSVSGNVGLHILKQFTLTFNLAHEKLYLERSAQYGKPDIFNRAGLVLDPDTDAREPALPVKLIFPDGPAARAGLA